MRRRRLLAGIATATGLLAGCTKRASEGTDSPTPTATRTETGTPTPTPACPDETYRDEEGELDLEYGYETPDDETYESTLRVDHVSTPACRYESTPCDREPTEQVVTEETLYVANDTGYGIVPLPLSTGVDTYHVAFTANGETVRTAALEQAARSLVDDAFPFYVCNPGVRRLGFLVEDGTPRIEQV